VVIVVVVAIVAVVVVVVVAAAVAVVVVVVVVPTAVVPVVDAELDLHPPVVDLDLKLPLFAASAKVDLHLVVTVLGDVVRPAGRRRHLLDHQPVTVPAYHRRARVADGVPPVRRLGQICAGAGRWHPGGVSASGGRRRRGRGLPRGIGRALFRRDRGGCVVVAVRAPHQAQRAYRDHRGQPSPHRSAFCHGRWVPRGVPVETAHVAPPPGRHPEGDTRFGVPVNRGGRLAHHLSVCFTKADA